MSNQEQHKQRKMEDNNSHQNRAENPPMIRASFSSKTVDEEKRTVELVFGTDAPVRMWTWDGPILESLSFKDGEVDLTRLNSGAPLLDNHRAWGSIADIVLGVVERAWTDGKRGYAIVRFADDEKSDAVFRNIKKGIIRNVSVGYQVHKYKVERSNERDKMDLWRAVDWEPSEISMVAVPADSGAQVRSMSGGQYVIEYEEDDQYEEIINQRSAQIRAALAQYPNK